MAADTLYLETGSTDPAYNLAFEEVVLQNRREGNTLLLWQNDHAVVTGRTRTPRRRSTTPLWKPTEFGVVRRNDRRRRGIPRSWKFELFLDDGCGKRRGHHLSTIYQAGGGSAAGAGMAAEASGRNDILVEGRKVSGTAQRLLGKRILHHGTLLFDSDPEMIAGALRVDASKFQSKSTKSVRSAWGISGNFCGRI